MFIFSRCIYWRRCLEIAISVVVWVVGDLVWVPGWSVIGASCWCTSPCSQRYGVWPHVSSAHMVHGDHCIVRSSFSFKNLVWAAYSLKISSQIKARRYSHYRILFQNTTFTKPTTQALVLQPWKVSYGISLRALSHSYSSLNFLRN